jgi:hypothetical protein
VLTCRVGRLELRKTLHVLPLGLGLLAISIVGARHFGQFYGGL